MAAGSVCSLGQHEGQQKKHHPPYKITGYYGHSCNGTQGYGYKKDYIIRSHKAAEHSKPQSSDEYGQCGDRSEDQCNGTSTRHDFYVIIDGRIVNLDDWEITFLPMKISRTDRQEKPASGSELPDEFLVQVQKPARYIGDEINAVKKDTRDIDLHMGLCFPDVYEVGMSHLGLKILYAIVNSRPKLYAERVFAPWPDMEDLLRRNDRRLTTLETGTPLADLDIIGFSLQYELCATTVLQMLDLAGIPLRSADRGEDHPFVIAGGPTAFNPAPMAVFFDVFVIGDGEEVILDLADAHIEWQKRKGPRRELLEAWKGIPGIYVPSLHRNGESVSRRIVNDLDAAAFPTNFILPFCEIIHDRVGMEVARGCTRGCRFCQAGMLYRPVRERAPKTIMELARQNLRDTGWEEIALLSLSTGDYSGIGRLIQEMVDELSPERTAVSLPSLRTDTFEAEMAEQIRRVRKTGFTLAPEAGTDRLRRVINKGNTEEDLEKAITAAFQLGWQSVKLYFMIGLPTETDEDLDGIIGVIRKASKWTRGGKITASVSTFVPKCHTPFQWAGQISSEETLRKQQYIRRYFRKGNAQVKFHDPRVSFLEGIIARGDERLSAVIQKAFERGQDLTDGTNCLNSTSGCKLSKKRELIRNSIWRPGKSALTYRGAS